MQPHNPAGATAPAAPPAFAPPPAAPSPFGAPPAASPFGPPPTQLAQPGAAAAPANTFGTDEFGGATMGGGELPGPRIRDYGPGRLLLITPKLVEVAKGDDGKDYQRIVGDCVALDGNPISWGGTPEKMPAVPHDKLLPIGTLVEDMFISGTMLVRALKAFLPPAKISRCLARLTLGTQGKKGNQPWLLDSSPEAVRPADVQRAQAWLANYRASTIGAAPGA